MKEPRNALQLLNHAWKGTPLNSPDMREDTVRALAEKMVGLMRPLAIANLANAIAIAVSFSFILPIYIVAMWFLPAFAYAGLQLMASQRFSSIKSKRIFTGKLIRRGEMSALICGLIYGTAGFLFLTDLAVGNIALFAVLLGVCAGTVAMSGPVMGLSTRFMLPVIPMTIASAILSGSPFAVAVGVLGISFWAAMVLAAYMSFCNTVDLVNAKQAAEAAHRRLVRAINSRTDAFAVFDPDGRKTISNALFDNWIDVSELDLSEPLRGEALLPSGRWVMRSCEMTSEGGRVVVLSDITELKDRESELIAARREAEQADQAKSRFLSTMSHELRTPLNIILGFSKLMTKESRIQLSDDEIHEYADNIRRAGDHLLTLINDIIDYSKIGLDKYLLDREIVDVSDMLQRAADLARSYAEVGQCPPIEIQMADQDMKLSADATALQRIVVNLLSNAIKFGGPGGKVIVRSGCASDGRPFIAVRDNGPGIPDESMQRVFEAFYQVGSGKARNYGGAGLGLTLSRRLTQLHGGEVMLRNHDGGGLTALVVFPASMIQQTPGAMIKRVA